MKSVTLKVSFIFIILTSLVGVRTQDHVEQTNSNEDASAQNNAEPPHFGSAHWKASMAERTKDMFHHSFFAYMKNAFPHDELKPLSCTGTDTWGSYSLTLIDSLDTLLVMGFVDEFVESVRWVCANVNFDRDLNVSVFETNIRVLGALLSAHLMALDGVAMSAEQRDAFDYDNCLLRAAVDIGSRLLPAFETKTGIPYGTVNLRHGVPHGETTVTCTAGGGTFALEFGTLSRLTGDMRYEEAARRAMRSLFELRSQHDLVGNHIDIDSGKWTVRDAGVGHGVDSFYESALKAAALFGDHEYAHMFDQLYDGVLRHLKHGDFYVERDLATLGITWPVFNALYAFWPGLQVLHGDVRAAVNSTRAFFALTQNQGGLPPEKVHLVVGLPLQHQSGYWLRPELVESIYYLARAFPSDNEWQLMAALILSAIDAQCRVECGFAAVQNVADADATRRRADRMDSFFLAETLKYLYLTFDTDNVLNRRHYVFQTEAHPLPFDIGAHTHRTYRASPWHGEPHSMQCLRDEAASDDARLTAQFDRYAFALATDHCPVYVPALGNGKAAPASATTSAANAEKSDATVVKSATEPSIDVLAVAKQLQDGVRERLELARLALQGQSAALRVDASEAAAAAAAPEEATAAITTALSGDRCQTRTSACGEHCGSHYVTCYTNELLTGGGCRAAMPLTRNHRGADGTTWQCGTSRPTHITAYAVCCARSD